MGKVREFDPEGFSQFWALWLPVCRKTDGRGKCRETYRKWLLDGAEPADIIDGAAWYLRSLSEKDKPYIPLAASWLNSERWADDCERERDYQRRKAELDAQKDRQKAAQSSNIHVLHQPGDTRGSPDKSPDNRPTEEERTRHAQAVLARAGLAAASNGA